MARTKNAKVVIVGLLPPQQRILLQASPHLDLVFIDKNRRGLTLPKADLYVVWAKFISHAISDLVIRTAGEQGVDVLVHHSGLKNLAKILNQWQRPV